MKYLIKAGDALSQLANVIFLNGHPNESLSGRAYRTGSKWKKVIDTLLWLDTEHCKTSHQNDVAYAKDLIEGKL